MSKVAYMYPTEAEYIYPAKGQADWVNEMLAEWQDSGKRYLSFPFLRFHVHTLLLADRGPTAHP